MKIKLEITASPELLEAIKLIFGGNTQPTALKPVTDPGATAQKSARASRAANTAKETTKEEISAGATQEETEEKTASNGPVTVETVRAAVQVKAQGGKRDQVKSLLTQFKVARVTDLPETKYAEFLEEVNAL